MLIPNHPDDERISALASRDTDAIADAELTSHVSSCNRCTELMTELGALRLALADLPDLAPSRPLQLVPPVEADHAVDRLGGWARRFFAPVLVSGAALVLSASSARRAPPSAAWRRAGLRHRRLPSGLEAGRDIGAPAAASAAPHEFADASDAAEAPGPAHGGEAAGAASQRAEASAELQAFSSDGSLAGLDAGTESDETASVQTEPAADRSPWPMVLFAGVALIVAALLGRWILAPRSA